MQRNFSSGELKKWARDFTANPAIPFVTESGLIDLQDLEDFISAIKKQHAAGIRICFLRFSQHDFPTDRVTLADGTLAEGCEWMEAGLGFTQAGIALVPTTGITVDENLIFSAEDIIEDNRVTVLMPGLDQKGTGLNPPGGRAVEQPSLEQPSIH